MNDASIEFNTQLKLDVLISGLSEVTRDYVERFEWEKFDEIVIPEGVKSIGKEAFSDCYDLASVTIGKGVKSIGDKAFLGCHILTNVTIPDSVTLIGEMAFARCNNLVDVTIPNNVKIGWFAFLGCYRAKNYPWYIPPTKISKISVQVS